MDAKKIGQRFINVMTKLDKLGVFYGENYEGKYHEKYPHCSNWFALHLDKHRGGFESILLNNGDFEKCFAISDRKDPVLMVIELLEESYDNILKDLEE